MVYSSLGAQIYGRTAPEAQKRITLWRRNLSFHSLFFLFSACATGRPFPEGQAALDLRLTLFDQGKFQEAIPYFQRATGENPKLAQAYLYLGRSQLSVRRWRDAIQPLRTAYRLAPQETKEEVFNILMDVLVAASLDGFGQAPSPKASP